MNALERTLHAPHHATEPVTLDELKALAEAAQPGPWRACGAHRDGCTCGQVWSIPADVMLAVALSTRDVAYTEGEGFTPEEATANALYIAAANPSTVLRLIARIRDLEGGTA